MTQEATESLLVLAVRPALCRQSALQQSESLYLPPSAAVNRPANTLHASTQVSRACIFLLTRRTLDPLLLLLLLLLLLSLFLLRQICIRSIFHMQPCCESCFLFNKPCASVVALLTSLCLNSSPATIYCIHRR